MRSPAVDLYSFALPFHERLCWCVCAHIMNRQMTMTHFGYSIIININIILYSSILSTHSTHC